MSEDTHIRLVRSDDQKFLEVMHAICHRMGVEEAEEVLVDMENGKGLLICLVDYPQKPAPVKKKRSARGTRNHLR